MSDMDWSDAEQADAAAVPIAIIGMAGRFPRARDVDAFWRNLRDGVHAVTFFSDGELEAAGVSPAALRDPGYVRARGVLEDSDLFDAEFFGINPREAEVMDPQHRVLLETAWEALESAGYDPAGVPATVAVYAGASASHYLTQILLTRPDVVEQTGGMHLHLANGRDFLATRVAHKLNLRGPALNVQTGCSTALVAVHEACQALAAGECDVALAGGVSIDLEQARGYRHTPGGLASPDGCCRAFDARAAGTVGGNGVGIVVLKRLEDAVQDGDHVRAVIRGSAVNNDGARKVGFTAPSVDGQAAAIGEALAVAGVDPRTVRYVEAHGSGTELGDPVEVAALTRAFGHTEETQFCAIGSVKTSIGHLDAAAGVAGLIKAVLAVEHGEIPASLHFTEPNPNIDFASSPFFVNTALRPWPGDGPRRAGVSSFGIGGTNAHVVLEQAPEPGPPPPAAPWQLLTLSARTPEALDEAAHRLAAHLRARPDLPLADVAHTLQTGRRAFPHRRALVARDGEDAAGALEAGARGRGVTGEAPDAPPTVAFLFPGIGGVHPGMGRGLYETEPVYRETVDRCAEILRPRLGGDLRELLHPPGTEEDGGTGRIDLRALLGRAGDAPDGAAARSVGTAAGQLCLFVTEYALARLWMHWGARPQALLGHSLGEYVAATLAQVWSLEDALAVMAERGRLVEEQPEGAMMGIVLPGEAVRPLLRDGLCIGAFNGPDITVVSGPTAAVDAIEKEMTARGIVVRRLLAARHAFHSAAMEPVAAGLEELLRGIRLQPPRIPLLSTVTGTWMTEAEATDPGYWMRHMVGPVRFSQGVEALAAAGHRVMLEVGPGHALRALTVQHPAWDGRPPTVVASLRHDYERHPDRAHLLGAAGHLWTAGVPLDWAAVHGGLRRRRVPLPTYPFQRVRYRIDRLPSVAEARPAAGRRADPADWIHVPAWTRAPLPPPIPAGPGDGGWLVLADGGGLGEGLAAGLRALGHAVAVARAGTAFGRGEDGVFTLRPGVPADLQRLRDALGSPPRNAALLWGLDGGEADGVEAFGAAQRRGYASVAALSAALGTAPGDGPLRLLVVTEGAQDVSGGEPVRPERATVLGACLVLPHEHPGVECRAVDVRRGGDGGGDRLVRQLLAEALAPAGAPVAALRGALRWTRGWQAVRPPEGAGALREGGAYLFFGALAAGGDLLVERLTGTMGARVALSVDPGFPAPDTWEAYVSAAPPDDHQARTIRCIRGREAAGAPLLLLRAEPSDAGQVRAAVDAARTAFGGLDGVVHVPRLGAAAQIAPLAQSGTGAVLGHLGRVARELDALRRATGDLALDFVWVQSSIFSAFAGPGIAGRAAVAALIDACAQRAAGEGAPWTSIGWDRWELDEEGPAARSAGGERAIHPAEGLRVYAALAALPGEPRVSISTHDLGSRIAGMLAPRAPAGPGAGTQSAELHPRPARAGTLHPPATPAEEILVDAWRELLGIGEIGVRDDFFQLGGHSLLGMQVISRIRERFGVDLPLRAIFEAPTIAALAEVINQAILLELETMSEDEARALMESGAT